MSLNRNLLETPAGRKVLFGALYLSEGAPIGYIWWALPTRLRVAGVPVEEITALTSVLVLPWVLKFFWAPLVDTLRSSRWTRRSWIILTQLLMGATLLPLLFLDLDADFAFVFPLLLFHAFAAATQDVSVDALSIATVPSRERGAVNGWMQAGMLAGRSLLGGGTLVLATYIGDQAIIGLLIGVVWSSTFLLLFMTRSGEELTGQERPFHLFALTLRGAVKRRETWLGLVFALIGGAGFEAVGSVAGPFLIDRGFSEGAVGWFFAVPVIIGMIGGALAGGYISDRIGRRKSVALFLVLLVLNILLLSLADALWARTIPTILYILLSTLYVCIGMFTSSSYALFMDLTNPHLGATQFSAFMGATNGCEAWAAFLVGRMIAGWGYAVAFGIMAGISLLALPAILRIFNERTPHHTGAARSSL